METGDEVRNNKKSYSVRKIAIIAGVVVLLVLSALAVVYRETLFGAKTKSTEVTSKPINTSASGTTVNSNNPVVNKANEKEKEKEKKDVVDPNNTGTGGTSVDPGKKTTVDPNQNANPNNTGTGGTTVDPGNKTTVDPNQNPDPSNIGTGGAGDDPGNNKDQDKEDEYIKLKGQFILYGDLKDNSASKTLFKVDFENPEASTAFPIADDFNSVFSSTHRNIDISKDGSLMAYCYKSSAGSNILAVREVASGNILGSIEIKNHSYPKFTPDGKQVIVVNEEENPTQNSLDMFDIKEKELKNITLVPKDKNSKTNPRISDKGDIIYLAYEDKEPIIVIYSRDSFCNDTGPSKVKLGKEFHHIIPNYTSDDGKIILYEDKDHNIHMTSRDTAVKPKLLSIPDTAAKPKLLSIPDKNANILSVDTEKIIYSLNSANGSELKVYDLQTGKTGKVDTRKFSNIYGVWPVRELVSGCSVPEEFYVEEESVDDADFEDSLIFETIKDSKKLYFTMGAKTLKPSPLFDKKEFEEFSKSALSHDGKLLAVLSNAGTLDIIDSSTGELIKSHPSFDSEFFSFSWDNKQLIFEHYDKVTDQSEILILDIEKDEIKRIRGLEPSKDSAFYSPLILPDGSGILYCTLENDFKTTNAYLHKFGQEHSHNKTPILTVENIDQMIVSSDNSKIAYWHKDIYIKKLDRSKEEPRTVKSDGTKLLLSFSPEGGKINYIDVNKSGFKLKTLHTVTKDLAESPEINLNIKRGWLISKNPNEIKKKYASIPEEHLESFI